MRTIQVKLIEQPGGCPGCAFYTTQKCTAPPQGKAYAPPCGLGTQFVVDQSTPIVRGGQDA